jgi:hypothetical protein
MARAVRVAKRVIPLLGKGLTLQPGPHFFWIGTISGMPAKVGTFTPARVSGQRLVTPVALDIATATLGIVVER